MKRVLTFLAIMLLPLSVWAMTPVSDQALSDVTGQAGVNINADVTMNIAIGTVAWGDESGLDGFWDELDADSAGYVGINNFNIYNLNVQARETDTYNGYYEADHLKPITIDVATDDTYGTDITFVRFGLGSLEITMDALDFNVYVGADNTTLATTGQKLGEVYLGNMQVYINPESYVDIYNARGAGTSGVTMNIQVTIDRFIMDCVSWGDSDGLTLVEGQESNMWISTTIDSTAGYVGLDTLVIDGTIQVAGAVSIDVATVSNGKYMLNTDYHASAMGQSVVHIRFGELGGDNFNFKVNGAITADVCLSPDQAFGANRTELGDIYISGVNVEILGGSWVDIWAH